MTTLLQPKSMVLTANDLRLHYLDWGNASAPPVVCVHGYTSSAQAFNAPARHLQHRFHIIAPDVRGHGESAWSPTGAYQYRDQVSDLEEIVDQLGLEQFTLIGTSMGGIIAMAYAGAHPERLGRLLRKQGHQRAHQLSWMGILADHIRTQRSYSCRPTGLIVVGREHEYGNVGIVPAHFREQ